MKAAITLATALIALLTTACVPSPDIRVCLFGPNCAPKQSASTLPAPSVRVDAGRDESAVVTDTVTLSGFAEHSERKILTHDWLQLGGPAVVLPKRQDQHIRFEAPPVNQRTVLTFRYSATGPNGATDSDTVKVTIYPVSDFSICFAAPEFAVTYVWSDRQCTTDPTEIAGASRVMSIYRQLEAEPNDTVGGSNPLTFPAAVDSEELATGVAGRFADDTDIDDYYAFTVPRSGRYKLNLCNDPLICDRGTVTRKLVFSLTDQDGKFLMGKDDHMTKARSTTQWLEAGIAYYVGVHLTDASGSRWDYNLTIVSTSEM